MLTTIEGIYRNGQIELLERPRVSESRVLVTFTEADSLAQAENAPRLMRSGMFPGAGVTTEEDFKLAEWRGDDSL